MTTSNPEQVVVTLEPDDSRHLASLCGPLNEHLRLIGERLGVQIRARGNTFQLSGPADRVHGTSTLLQTLYEEIRKGVTMTPERIHLLLREQGTDPVVPSGEGNSTIRTRKIHVKVRGETSRLMLATFAATM